MGAKTLDEWVNYLSGRHLPILNNTRRKLQELEPYEDIATVQFTNIALTDPGVVLVTLRHATELTSANLGGDINTMAAAAIAIGTSRLTGILAKLKPVNHYMDAENSNIYMHVVNRAYHAAFQAYGMACIQHDTNPEEIFTTSMLQDIGALMLLCHGQDVLKPINQFLHLEYEEQQQETLGFTLQQLSAALATQWQLSNFIQQSLTNTEHKDTGSRFDIIHLARQVACAAERGWETSEMETLLETVAGHLHVSVEYLQKEVRDNAIRSAEETPFYGVMPAAAMLPPLEEDDERVTKLKNKYSETVKETLANQPPSPPSTTSAPIPTPEIPAISPLNEGSLNRTIKEMETCLSGGCDLNQFMHLLKQAFQYGLGMEQAFFAMLSKDRANLVPRFFFAAEHRFGTLHIPARNNLFQKLLTNPQTLWVNDANRLKIVPLIPKDFYKTIDVDTFFVMTIRVKGRPIGIIYGDRHGNRYGLDETDYSKFQQLGQLLSKGLETISNN